MIVHVPIMPRVQNFSESVVPLEFKPLAAQILGNQIVQFLCFPQLDLVKQHESVHRLLAHNLHIKYPGVAILLHSSSRLPYH